jgi:hypothetical protein
MFKAFGPHRGTARALLNRTTDELLVLSVLLCRRGSRIVLHLGSQNHDLDAKPGGTGLLEHPDESLSKPDIIHKDVPLDDGGL